MFSVTVFLKKAHGWCYLLSHFDEGSLITAHAKSSRRFAYLEQELKQKVNAKLHTIFCLFAVMAEISVRANS